MDEFKTTGMNDAQIEVEDIAEGHVWTFTFARFGDGDRILGGCNQRSPDHTRATSLAARARRYADRETLKAGMIDRITSA